MNSTNSHQTFNQNLAGIGAWANDAIKDCSKVKESLEQSLSRSNTNGVSEKDKQGQIFQLCSLYERNGTFTHLDDV